MGSQACFSCWSWSWVCWPPPPWLDLRGPGLSGLQGLALDTLDGWIALPTGDSPKEMQEDTSGAFLSGGRPVLITPLSSPTRTVQRNGEGHNWPRVKASRSVGPGSPLSGQSGCEEISENLLIMLRSL